MNITKKLKDNASKENEKPAEVQNTSAAPSNPPIDPDDKNKNKDKGPEKDPKTGDLPLEGEREGFRGHRGFEMKNPKYQERQSKPEIIEGRQYSGHALDQMRNRGIPFSVVKDTIQSGVKSASRDGTSIFYNAAEKVQVIIDNATGNVITVKFGKL
ncbi:MAG: DUF4258 domain-containing protein [Puniceicoccales bacterium]|jgi:hypothetical protein|nr:DUF4258 domain-containing protein [Puniceicoccales bacterium]